MGLFTKDQPTIKITCQGATEISIDDIKPLQGDLKTLSDENRQKMKESLDTYGFTFPMFIWVDKEGVTWYIDAHQRDATLRWMRSELGYVVPKLPADYIHAKDRIEAKEKILLLQSQYGTMTETGFKHFIEEPNFKIDLPELQPLLVLPQVQFALPDINTEDKEEQPEKQESIFVCPNCEHKGAKKDFTK